MKEKIKDEVMNTIQSDKRTNHWSDVFNSPQEEVIKDGISLTIQKTAKAIFEDIEKIKLTLRSSKDGKMTMMMNESSYLKSKKKWGVIE